ncbi:MAG: hypothetical protein PWR10_2122 [Halanaerobiales bacterium]|nr:hypothetical protein [Halanaerobiales bacterium]
MNELELSLKELATNLLKRDILYSRLTHTKQAELIDFAISIGRKQARKCLASGLNPEQPELYLKKYCQLEFKKHPPQIPIYSEFEVKNNKIILYLSEIEEIVQGLEITVDKKRLINLFLLHEFFHFLEYNSIGPVSRMRKITVFKFLFLEIKRGLFSLSEIAAHAFVREFSGDPVVYINANAK